MGFCAFFGSNKPYIGIFLDILQNSMISYTSKIIFDLLVTFGTCCGILSNVWFCKFFFLNHCAETKFSKIFRLHHTPAEMNMYTCIYVYAYIFLYLYVHIYICMCKFLYLYIYIYIYIFVNIHIYIYQ